MEPFDESLPGTGKQIRAQACGRQAERTAGTVSQEGGLPGRGRKTSGRQYPKEHFHRLPLPDIRGVQCHALMLQHRGQTGSGRI